MRAFTLICPTTRLNVQHWLDGDEDIPDNEYQGVVCPACGSLHFLNRRTGKQLGMIASRGPMRSAAEASVPTDGTVSTR
jgi:hypothetical protein